MLKHAWLIATLGTALALATTGCEAVAKKKKTSAAASARSEADNARTYAGRDDAMRFADAVAERHGLEAALLRAKLSQARYLPSVARLIMPPAAGTAKNWAAYRDRFIDPARIGAGVAFWRANASWLERAEQTYGVPPEIVVGIIGVETIYGRNTGSFRAVDALATLAFDFPAGRRDRSAFFRDELEALFVLAAREQRDVLDFKGSYAGALGWPQFMPSSWNRYAIDFDADGHVDLHGSTADVIGSVAHYMAEFGWTRGMPTHYAVAPPVDSRARALLLAPDILPSFTAAQFAEHGAELSESGRGHVGLMALVELQNGAAAPSYVAGTGNFYTVTRYNWSSYYALAVIELGEVVGRVVRMDKPATSAGE